MPEPDEILTVVQQWVQKAESDLKTATYTLQLAEDCPTDTVCFHAQQCIEKYVKALLVLTGLDFPRKLLPRKALQRPSPQQIGRRSKA